MKTPTFLPISEYNNTYKSVDGCDYHTMWIPEEDPMCLSSAWLTKNRKGEWVHEYGLTPIAVLVYDGRILKGTLRDMLTALKDIAMEAHKNSHLVFAGDSDILDEQSCFQLQKRDEKYHLCRRLPH